MNDNLIDALAVLAPSLADPNVQHLLRQNAMTILSSEDLAPVR